MLLRLATHMDPARFPCRVVSLIPPGAVGDRLREAGIAVDTLNMRRGIPSPLALWRLMRILRSFRPDLVQTWLYHADLLGLAAVRTAFPFHPRPALVWNLRCSFMDLKQYPLTTTLTLKACAALSRWPDAVLTNSSEARCFHEGLGYRPKQFKIIPNGFDTGLYRPDEAARRDVRNEFGIPQDAPVIGHVARFDPMKGHDTFIEAAALAESRLDNPHFLMIGRNVDADNVRLTRWLSQSGLRAENVHLLGERADIPRLMAAMDVHVSSSRGESFPNTVGEAMACGVPNVVTDVGDSAILVGDSGRVVPPESPAALADTIAALFSHDCPIKNIGQSARKVIEKNYSLAAIAEDFSLFYEAIHINAL